jgi:GTP-binding protein HflX
VLTEDQLFSTLGSTVRRSALPGGDPILFSDTVGFVHRLPHQLVEAFRSTLEETLEATLLLHVVDASDAAAEKQIEAVREVLSEIGAANVDEMIVLNKLDAADPVAVTRLRALFPDAVAVSALTGLHIEELTRAVEDRLLGQMVDMKLFVPYAQAEVLAALHRAGEVVSEDHGQEGTTVRVKLFPADARPFTALEIA